MPAAGAIRAARAYVELFADDSQPVRGLRRAQSKLKTFGRSVQQFVSGQTELLRSHGYTVAAPASLRLSCELEEIDEVTRPLDLLVACSLGRRRASGWFEALRVDIHAAAARHVPLTLLP